MKNEKVYYWPKWTAEISSKKQSQNIDKPVLSKLSRSQNLIWRALNIYDDFLDSVGKPEGLPLANADFRTYIKIFYDLNLSDNFYILFHRLFRNLEQANRQEVIQNRLEIIDGKIIIPKKLPNFSRSENLSDKSLVLALAPLAVFDLMDKKNNKNYYLLKFFKYALSAKQLADDAEDWFEDLQKGQISAVNYLILKQARKKKININLNKPEELYSLFIKNAALASGQEILTLCAKARKEMGKIDKTENKLIRKIIYPLEKAVNRAKDFYLSMGLNK